jgi:hypothetical protein
VIPLSVCLNDLDAGYDVASQSPSEAASSCEDKGGPFERLCSAGQMPSSDARDERSQKHQREKTSPLLAALQGAKIHSSSKRHDRGKLLPISKEKTSPSLLPECPNRGESEVAREPPSVSLFGDADEEAEVDD